VCENVSFFDRHLNISTFSRLLLLVYFLFSASAVNVNAYDHHVASSTSAEGYSVYRRNGERLSRRRFVEDLTLAAWNILPGESDPYYKGPRLAIDVSFRVFGDAGITRDERTPRYENSYVPGLYPVEIDAITAYVDGRGFWEDTLDIRAGRHIRIDTLGFFALDGVSTRIRLPIRLDISTYLGLEVRGGKQLGYDVFELDGTDKGSRKDMEQEQYPDRMSPKNRLAFGAELVVFPWQWLEFSGAFRAVGINNGADNLADERVGGQVRVHHGRFRGTGRVIYVPLVGTVSEGNAELALQLLDSVTLSADYYRYVPVFEGNSIFNVFDLEPQNDLGGRVEIDIGQFIDTALWGFARFAADSAGISGDDTDAMLAGAGGGVGGNYRTKMREISARFTYVAEWGERRIGTEIGVGHALLRNQRLWLSLRGAYFNIDDDFSTLYSGNVFGYAISARFNIAKGFRTLGEFEHYLGDGRAARMTALALLELDLWR
jgi:hypothetical protein